MYSTPPNLQPPAAGEGEGFYSRGGILALAVKRKLLNVSDIALHVKGILILIVMLAVEDFFEARYRIFQ